jgi:DNA-binding GntR family transcriptional regulator
MSGAARLLTETRPRYAVVAATLADEIAAGRPGVGALLATEQELCARFGVSRSTVREALRRLRALGLVDAAHGIGTRVVAARPRPGYAMAVRSLAELMGYEGPTRLVVQERGPYDGDGEAIGFPGDEALFRIAGQRMSATGAGEPIACAEMVFAAAHAALSERPEIGSTPVYRMIEAEHGLPILEMRQEITAIALAPAAARVFGVPAGAPGLRILRQFFTRGQRLLEATVNTHPAGDRFAYRVHLTAPGVAAPD